MARFTHLLDTSALLAHYLDESGAAEVGAIWNDRAARVAVSVLSIPELETRLRIELSPGEDLAEVSSLYFKELTVPLAVDRAVAREAARLRRRASARLPLVDACIAATAKIEGSTLVHRDPHFAVLPSALVRQHRLPEHGHPP